MGVMDQTEMLMPAKTNSDPCSDHTIIGAVSLALTGGDCVST